MKKFLGIVVGLLVVVGLAFVVFRFGFHFGDGNGNGDATRGVSISESDTLEPDPVETSQRSEIRIEWNDIYLDDELCEDENDLKEKLTNIGPEREYEFVHDNATKGTYDKVREVLSGLADVLDIKVIDG